MKCDNLKNKKILVTGGTGFVGRQTVADLTAAGAETVVLTRRALPASGQTRFVTCDLKTATAEDYQKILAEYGPFDAVLYMAANIPVIGQKKENWAEALDSTLVPLVRFAQSVTGQVKKFVYISSIDVVGVPDRAGYDESCPTPPFTPYGAAKLAGELYLKSLCALSKTAFTALRFAQVYGPREPLLRVIPILLNALETGQEFKLYGTGEEKRRFLYVKDASAAVQAALASEATGIFNIAGKGEATLLSVIAAAEQISGKKLRISRVDTAAATFDNVPDTQKAARVLGFEPRYSLEEGLKEIIHAHRG